MIPIAILAGGKGTRLGPLTDHTPKSLMDVNGQPFILRQLALLKRHGYTQVVLLTGHLGEQIRDVVGNGAAYGMQVEYSDDGGDPIGTAGAVRQALRRLGERFFVLYGDSYLDCDYGLVDQLSAVNHANVSTWWDGFDYGLSVFYAADLAVLRYADLTDVRRRLEAMDRLIYLPMRARFEEIGSLDGLERVRALTR